MLTRLLATTAICGLTFFAATPAFAACTNYAPGNSTTSTCSGTTTTAISSNAISSEVFMNSNAQLNVTGSAAITLGTNARVNANGASGVNGISSDQTAIVLNWGTINLSNGATLSGNIAANIANGLNMNMSGGIITAVASGINAGATSYYTGTGGSLTVTAGTGITFTSNGYVNITSGSTVNASTTAIVLGSNGRTLISGSSSVTGGTTGVSFASGTSELSVTGTGTLTGTGGTAADMTGAASSIFTLGSAATVTGNVNASTAGTTDEFHFQATTDTSFAINTLGTKYNNFERFIKEGTGTTTLTGTSSYTGTTAVDAGILAVNGTLTSTSAVAVNNNGTLGGTGTVRNVTVNSGGKLAPGNSIGTLNVTGTLDFSAGSRYAVEYDNASADKTIASGAVTINNAAILDLTGTGASGTYAANTTHTILQGSSVTGTFGTINNNLAFLNATQINTGTALQIALARNDTSFADVAKDSQQRGVAVALDQIASTNLGTAFTGLSTAQAQVALDNLSGEHNAGLGTAIAESTGFVQNVLSTHMTGLTHSGSIGDVAALSQNTDPSIYTAAFLEPGAGLVSSRMWMQIIGSIGKTDADRGGGTPQQDRNSYGAIGGIDVPYQEGYVGIFTGFERGEVSTDSQGASSNLNNYHLGAYGTKSIWEGITLSGGASGSYHDIESVRHITVGGVQFSPHGDTDAWTVNTFAELSKPVTLRGLAIEPFAGIGLTYNRMNGYTETGGGAANLAVSDSSAFNPSTIIGARFGKALNFESSKINLSASLGWQHTFGDIDGKVSQRFASGTTSFSAFGPARSRDAAVIALGVDTDVNNTVKAFAGYDGTYSSNSRDHGFKAGLKVGF